MTEHKQDSGDIGDEQASLEGLAEIAGDAPPASVRRERATKKNQRKSVSNARVALLVVFVLSLLGSGLYFLLYRFSERVDSPVESLAYALLALLFLGLYAWGRRKPYPALLTGLCIFSGLWLIDIGYALITEPIKATNGLLPRIVILIFLIRGVAAAKKRQQQKQSALANASPD